MDIKTEIINRSKALLDAPIVDLVESDEDGLNAALETAFTDYWSSFPYISRQQITSLNVSPMFITFDEIIEKAFSDVLGFQTEDAYCIGLTQVNESKGITNGAENYINNIILGVNARASNDMTDLKTVADSYEKIIAAATSINMFSGTLDVKKDQVKKKFSLYLPSAYSQYILDWALGFRYSDDNLKYIDTKYILLFAEMVGTSFLERVLAGRSAIQLQADFSISVSFLEKKIGEMKTKLTDELTRSTIVPMIWG